MKGTPTDNQKASLDWALEDVSDALQSAIDATHEAIKLARRCDDPEVQRVIAGQLDLYLLGTLRAFAGEPGWHQTGNLVELRNILEELAE
jgi:hypothetical protein